MTRLQAFTELEKKKFISHKYSFWAKRFDTEIHIPIKDGAGTHCGSSAHLLGNNYAQYMTTSKYPICSKCVKIKYRNELQIL